MNSEGFAPLNEIELQIRPRAPIRDIVTVTPNDNTIYSEDQFQRGVDYVSSSLVMNNALGSISRLGRSLREEPTVATQIFEYPMGQFVNPMEIHMNHAQCGVEQVRPEPVSIVHIRSDEKNLALQTRRASRNISPPRHPTTKPKKVKTRHYGHSYNYQAGISKVSPSKSFVRMTGSRVKRIGKGHKSHLETHKMDKKLPIHTVFSPPDSPGPSGTLILATTPVVDPQSPQQLVGIPENRIPFVAVIPRRAAVIDQEYETQPGAFIPEDTRFYIASDQYYMLQKQLKPEYKSDAVILDLLSRACHMDRDQLSKAKVTSEDLAVKSGYMKSGEDLLRGLYSKDSFICVFTSEKGDCCNTSHTRPSRARDHVAKVHFDIKAHQSCGRSFPSSSAAKDFERRKKAPNELCEACNKSITVQNKARHQRSNRHQRNASSSALNAQASIDAPMYEDD